MKLSAVNSQFNRNYSAQNNKDKQQVGFGSEFSIKRHAKKELLKAMGGNTASYPDLIKTIKEGLSALTDNIKGKTYVKYDKTSGFFQFLGAGTKNENGQTVFSMVHKSALHTPIGGESPAVQILKYLDPKHPLSQKYKESLRTPPSYQPDVY